MSVLKKIRENVGLVIVIIALSLLTFIISSVLDNFGPRGDNSIGEVNGKSIDYTLYDQKFELAQRNNPNATTTAEQYQLKEQAWQSLVREAYYTREWENSGIGISGDELRMIFEGRIYHPYVQQFPYFFDSTGRFNPGVAAQLIEQSKEIDPNDPRFGPDALLFKQRLEDLTDIVSLDRRSSKWQSAIKGSALVSDNEVKASFEAQQRAADISYVFVPYASIPDQQLQVTDGDRNDYYNKHREAFKLSDDMARIKYTFFKISPSRGDSAKVREDLVKLSDEFKSSTTPFNFASSASDDRAIDSIPKPLAELPAALSAVNGRTDTVVGPLVSQTGMQLLRVVKVTEDSLVSNVKARHILIALNPGATKEDSARAQLKADSLLRVVNADPTKFGEVAAASSDDQATKFTGGDLGWRPDNSFGEPLSAKMKSTPVGTRFTGLSPQGYHVVDLQDRSNKLYSFAAITRTVNASTQTRDSIFKRASLFHGDILGGADMDSNSVKYPDARTLSSGNIGPGTFNLPGLDAGRPVIAWAFNNEEGTLCQKIIDTDDALVVAKVEYKGSRGYANIESLKADPTFEMNVRNYVKAKQIKGKLGSGGTDLQTIASSYGPGATTGQAKDLHFASNEVPGLGNEPKVVGRAFGLQPNAVSVPLAGNSGVFVVKLDAIREPAPMDDNIKMFTASMMKQSKVEGTINALFQGMRENAEVIDQRYKAEKSE